MAEATLAKDTEFEPLLVSEITRARNSIWLQTFLFDISFHRDRERRVRRVAHLLLEAAGDGLDVRLLLASPGSTSVAIPNLTTAIYCSALGMQVRLSARSDASHKKLAIFDSVRCLVGGHNITHSALRLNQDASILVEGQRLAAQASTLFAQGWEAGVTVGKRALLSGRVRTEAK